MYNFVYKKIRHNFSDCQHGFRPRRSTFTLLLDYVDKLYFFNDKNEDFRCVYFDFKKPLDSVSHIRLLFKLEKFGFDKKFVHLISSYLSDRKQHVRISNVLSSPLSVPSGVLQGSILGPILFSIFINDMLERVRSSTCYLFADDLKFLSFSSSINFQNVFDNVYQWSVEIGLIFHLDKTRLICNTPHDFFLNSLVIERVPSIKDLGLFVTPNLSWTAHVNIKSGKALR